MEAELELLKMLTEAQDDVEKGCVAPIQDCIYIRIII